VFEVVVESCDYKEYVADRTELLEFSGFAVLAFRDALVPNPLRSGVVGLRPVILHPSGFAAPLVLDL